jgi:hypothetical protein
VVVDMADQPRDPTISALVVLRPASGRTLDGQEAITAESVAEFEPDAAASAQTEAYFRKRGFEVDQPVGISFSITGPRSLFESTFGEQIVTEQSGGVLSSARPASGGLELPVEHLPAAVVRAVQAVTFTPPPAFGPGNP